MNLLDTIISTVIVISLPIGAIIPETTIRCGGIFGGVYYDSKIYVCDDGNKDFYIAHERFHAIWDRLTIEDKEIYTKAYHEAKKKGKLQFYRTYSMSSVEEDFADMGALIVTGEKTKLSLKKRIKLISSFLTL